MPTVKPAARRQAPAADAPPRVPAGQVVYAVGDIHGRLDLLAGVTAELRRAAAETASGLIKERVSAVFLGDYVDRGPDSRGVLDHLIAFAKAGVCDARFLRGNHEQILLDLIDGGERADPVMWLEYGGVETLASYGVEVNPAAAGRDVTALQAKLRAAIPPEHLAFLRATALTVERGDYLFVHAGLRADRLIEEQSEADLLWYRFFDDRKPTHGKVVVHGHTPHERPVVGRWRVGLDTGAYDSGALTAVVLRGADQRFLKFEAGPNGGPALPTPWDLTLKARRAADRRPTRERSQVRTPASGRSALRIAAWSRAAVFLAAMAVILALAWAWLAHAHTG